LTPSVHNIYLLYDIFLEAELQKCGCDDDDDDDDNDDDDDDDDDQDENMLDGL